MNTPANDNAAPATYPFPHLRDFITGTVEELAAGRITLADVDQIFETFEMGMGLDENEKAFAAKLEEIGMEAAPDAFATTPEFRRGFIEGVVATTSNPDQLKAAQKAVKNKARRQRQGRK